MLPANNNNNDIGNSISVVIIMIIIISINFIRFGKDLDAEATSKCLVGFRTIGCLTKSFTKSYYSTHALIG